ncbi:uncharacterized protein LOC131665674 [Phymastichus coffea]|uniref:uncharacterized protein LOC131665674 n=1 Tax=Phymastichus coffea TaxID=108790 RepID=UPI00273CF3F8|nr:uncharacterized protein LOC131665674 [Phymastichus coffea]
MTSFKVFIGVLACCYLTLANPRPETKTDNYKANILSVMDSLNRKDSIDIFGNIVRLEKTEAEEASEARQVETDPLLKRIDEFLRTRRLQIKFPDDGSSADYFGRALGEKNYNFELRELIHGASEARTKVKKILLPILLALKLKAAIVLPIVITLIGLIGIKGLGAGVLALLLSGAVALKALLTPSTPAYPARISFSKPYDLYHENWHRSQQILADDQPIVTQPYRAWSPEFSYDPTVQFSPSAQYESYQEIP